jgi:O-acetyl-ADP-ribose deacetylase (regulator of RNase III)
MFKTIHGNLITLAEQGEFDIIIHGANCFHCMGGGIAKQLADKYPEVARADKQTQYGDRNKLGTSTTCIVNTRERQFIVENVYTQYYWSQGKDVFEYDSFQKFLDETKKYFEFGWMGFNDEKAKLGFPQIGAGLAGGDWSRISKMIEKFAEDVSEFADVTVVIYKP